MGVYEILPENVKCVIFAEILICILHNNRLNLGFRKRSLSWTLIIRQKKEIE